MAGTGHKSQVQLKGYRQSQLSVEVQRNAGVPKLGKSGEFPEEVTAEVRSEIKGKGEE